MLFQSWLNLQNNQSRLGYNAVLDEVPKRLQPLQYRSMSCGSNTDQPDDVSGVLWHLYAVNRTVSSSGDVFDGSL